MSKARKTSRHENGLAALAAAACIFGAAPFAQSPFCAGSLHAGVVMDQSTVSFTPANGSAEISYVLGDEPAIVTIEIQTNTLANGTGEWVDIGGENVQHLLGGAYVKGLNGDCGWQKVEGETPPIPAGAWKAYLLLYCTEGATGRAFFDDVEVSPSSADTASR